MTDPGVVAGPLLPAVPARREQHPSSDRARRPAHPVRVRQRLACWVLLRLWPEGFCSLWRGVAAEAAERAAIASIDPAELARLKAEAAKLPELEAQVRALHRKRFPRSVRYGRSMDELLSDLRLATTLSDLELP